VTFETLTLHPAILKALADAGYTTPTPIQSEAIPALLDGHDLMASAQTGTGKTAAFMLPALHRLAEPSKVPGRGPRVLVLTPTRELALQVTAAVEKYGRHLKRLAVVSVLGGVPYAKQLRALSGLVDVLVATPGRLMDHLQRGRVDFSRLEILVLDEADRMLDMGFIDDVETIARATPATRQTLLFSATLGREVGRLAGRLLKDPKRIEIATQHEQRANIDQRLHFADDAAHKNRLLDHLLRDADLAQAIVFTATKRDADALAVDLEAQGHDVAALHGDMHQTARTRTLTRLRQGRIRVLVATDVAARGIDVPAISHVINYDLPRAAEDYVHRIGRTGRAGAPGIAVSLASQRDRVSLARIERFIGRRILATVIPGLEPRVTARPDHPRSHKPAPARDGWRKNTGAGRQDSWQKRERSAAPGRSRPR
jgi:superfamily II DNA/RNA helicase